MAAGGIVNVNGTAFSLIQAVSVQTGTITYDSVRSLLSVLIRAVLLGSGYSPLAILPALRLP